MKKIKPNKLDPKVSERIQNIITMMEESNRYMSEKVGIPSSKQGEIKGKDPK